MVNILIIASRPLMNIRTCVLKYITFIRNLEIVDSLYQIRRINTGTFCVYFIYMKILPACMLVYHMFVGTYVQS